MSPVIDQPGYIVLWHLRQLLLKYALEPREDDKALALVIIIDHSKLNLAIALLDHCWLFEEDQSASIHRRLAYAFFVGTHTFSGKGTTLRGFLSVSGDVVWAFLMRLFALGLSGSSRALRLLSGDNSVWPLASCASKDASRDDLRSTIMGAMLLCRFAAGSLVVSAGRLMSAG